MYKFIMKGNSYLRCLFMLHSSCFENIIIINTKIKPWTFCTSDSNWFTSTHSGFKIIVLIKSWNLFQHWWMWHTNHDMRSYIPLNSLFLLNKFRIFFHSNLDVSLSQRAPLIIRVDFDLLLCFCNFPWLLLPSSSSSNCVLFCFALRVFSFDIMNKSVFLLMFPVVLSELLFDS